jgi:hypothetical protein
LRKSESQKALKIVEIILWTGSSAPAILSDPKIATTLNGFCQAILLAIFMP